MKPHGGTTGSSSTQEPQEMLRAAQSGSRRLRSTSTSAEGRWIIATGLLLAFGCTTVIEQFSWWESMAGIVLLIAFYAVLGIVIWRQSRNRTVRPKHFSRVWRASGLWAGLILVASLFITHGVDRQVPLLASIALGIACAAPTIACGIWLVVRSR